MLNLVAAIICTTAVIVQCSNNPEPTLVVVCAIFAVVNAFFAVNWIKSKIKNKNRNKNTCKEELS